MNVVVAIAWLSLRAKAGWTESRIERWKRLVVLRTTTAAFRGFLLLIAIPNGVAKYKGNGLPTVDLQIVSSHDVYRDQPYILATTCVIHAIPRRVVGRATIARKQNYLKPVRAQETR